LLVSADTAERQALTAWLETLLQHVDLLVDGWALTATFTRAT
jgi:hypothetical protein